MVVLETARMRLVHLEQSDAPFMLRLMNEPGWLKYIGDRNVRTNADAEAAIAKYAASYNQHGFGLYRMQLRESGESVGICGLVQRDYLDDADLGFALLSEWEGRGLANEAAVAVLQWACTDLKRERVLAITTPANQPSIRLLKKLEMVEESSIEEDGEELLVFATSSAT